MAHERDRSSGKLRVLFISQYYPPEMGGAAGRIHGLARWLVTFGHSVTVITGFPNYPSGIIEPRYRRKLRLDERVDGVEIVRSWIFASSGAGSLGRLLNYFSFVFSSVIVGLMLDRGFDVVVASSPPLFLGIAGASLARARRVPLVFDVRDLWPDVAVEAGAFKPEDNRVRLGTWLAHYIYEKADRITPVTWKKREKIIAAGVDPHKITVVENGVDFDQLSSERPGLWREKLHLGDSFVVTYTGLIGIAQGVGIAVEAAHLLRDNKRVHFLIVGEGVEREKLMKSAMDLNLQNITFISSQPRSAIPSLLGASDVALVPLVSPNVDDAVPSKLLEAWACGKPVILVAGGEAAELVIKANGGAVLGSTEPHRLADLITSLDQDRDRLRAYAENGLSFVRSNFDRKDLARKMECVLLEVVGSPRSDNIR